MEGEIKRSDVRAKSSTRSSTAMSYINPDSFTMGFQQTELILKYSSLSGTEEQETKGYVAVRWEKNTHNNPRLS